MTHYQVMQVPKHVDIAITGRCNLDCKYCFYADEMVSRTDLTTEQWLAFFDELGRLGVMSVTLTGGEVFTRRDLFELIDGIIANRMRYSLLTNGTLITEKVIEQFKVGKRRLRLNSIQISIDGSTAEIHNKSRPKSFDRAVRGLRLLKAANLPITSRITINRHNADDLENMARLLLDDIGMPNISTNEAYSCGETVRDNENVILTPSQRVKVMAELSELAERYNGRITAQAGPLSLDRHFKQIEELMAQGITSIPGRGTLSACGAMFNKISVLHDGTIVPCHQLSDMHIGNILTDDFKEIWLHHETMTMMRERRSIPLESLDTCRGCEYQGFCTGGCPGGALFMTHNINARSPMDCYRVHKGLDAHFKLEEDIPSPALIVTHNAAPKEN
jgi:SynChlorMet cassette radical SAM/SPASM protein ScmE